MACSVALRSWTPRAPGETIRAPMILVLEPGRDSATLLEVHSRLQALGLVSRDLSEARPGLLAVSPSDPNSPLSAETVEDIAREVAAIPGVGRFVATRSRHPLASRELHPDSTLVTVRRPGCADVTFGGSVVPVLAGPCSVESEEQIVSVARSVKAAGATVLRGGAFKPRTSPYAFQGLGLRGLQMLDVARRDTGLLVATEALDAESLDLVAQWADIVQIGTRNMSNFPLLRAAGRCGRPVLLKRGFSSTLEEWLLAAEYVLAEGNPDVILCERGVRTFGDHARFVLDLNIVPAAKAVSHLPVIADPSHGTGRSDCVEPLARASVAVGADGVMLEVHPDPAHALSDGPQALLPERLPGLVRELDVIASAIGRSVLSPATRTAR
jgi:3-deoxy-7-phosphoheptulonate synthase